MKETFPDLDSSPLKKGKGDRPDKRQERHLQKERKERREHIFLSLPDSSPLLSSLLSSIVILHSLAHTVFVSLSCLYLN
jgi:hypothetical protein